MNAETTNARCTPTSQASLLGVEHRVDIHECLQHLDRGDRHDRGEQLLLQSAEIDLGHPIRPIRVTARINLRDEILVAGEHHDQDQIAGQRDVDQREHAQDDVGLLGARRVDDELPQQHAEFEQQHRKADDEAEIERRHQPAAVEDQAFEAPLDALESGWADKEPAVPSSWLRLLDAGPYAAYAAFFLALISLRLIRHSAIWIAFSAAPLRKLSETHHSTRPLSTVESARMRLI